MSMQVSVLDVAKLILRIRNEPQADGATLQIVTVSMSKKDGKDAGFLIATNYARKGEREMEIEITPVDKTEGECDVSETEE